MQVVSNNSLWRYTNKKLNNNQRGQIFKIQKQKSKETKVLKHKSTLRKKLPKDRKTEEKKRQNYKKSEGPKHKDRKKKRQK